LGRSAQRDATLTPGTTTDAVFGRCRFSIDMGGWGFILKYEVVVSNNLVPTLLSHFRQTQRISWPKRNK
jgi:hypothetical protein